MGPVNLAMWRAFDGIVNKYSKIRYYIPHPVDINTTATFIEIISKWFTLLTARTPRVALGIK